MGKSYIVTGGTGFLGSLLSVELIKRGDKVIFLGRPNKDESFEKRIKKTINSVSPGLSLSNTSVFEIDLRKDDLGLSREYTDSLMGKVDGIWHLAANLSFRERDREEIFKTNVDGLKNILGFASKINSPVFYTSTAYIHGQRQGIIFEDELIKPNCFNNPYEESKFKGEKIIRDWGRDKKNKFIVFRPAILIEKKRKTLSFFGYYIVVYSLYKMRERLGDKKITIPIPFPYSKNCFLNLMPTDIAIKWMLDISSKPKAFGRTFNIANPLPFSMKEITKQTFRALGIRIPVIRMPKWLIRLSFSAFYLISFLIKPLKPLAKKLYYYRYYMTEYNIYDMSNTKEIIGQNLAVQFDFQDDFIEHITKDFIRKLKENNEGLHNKK